MRGFSSEEATGKEAASPEWTSGKKNVAADTHFVSVAHSERLLLHYSWNVSEMKLSQTRNWVGARSSLGCWPAYHPSSDIVAVVSNCSCYIYSWRRLWSEEFRKTSYGIHYVKKNVLISVFYFSYAHELCFQTEVTMKFGSNEISSKSWIALSGLKSYAEFWYPLSMVKLFVA